MYRRQFLKLSAAAVVSARATTAAAPNADLPLPEWAQTGNFVHMGLDGGPLEAEKGLRSGWEHFTRDDPRGVVQAVREFYRPENVEIPVAGGANWVFLTWTNGWSKERERREQWPLAAGFMEECRRRGIHTSAYISAANMFWEDYLERVPQSRRWIETVQPGAIRHYGGSMQRVMANIKLPEWRNELKTSIDAALDAGAEGFWVDNLFWWHGHALFEDLLRELQMHAARRKSNVVWHTNVNRGIYNWARVGNVVGTEDGRVPQFNPGTEPAVSGNLGLLSFVSGLKEGWRSAEVEHYGNNMPAGARQLIAAECWMWQAGASWFPVDRLMQANLHRREPAAWKVFEAMGVYNRHQLKHREFFRPAEPLATAGVVGHAGSSGKDVETQQRTQNGQGELISLLDALAGWDVQLEVLFEDRLRPRQLRAFSVVVLADPEHIPAGGAEALTAYAADGGTLIVPEGAQLAGAKGKVIALPKEAFRVKGTPALLRDQIKKSQAPPSVEVRAPEGVLHRALRQRDRLLVHLVNYKTAAAGPCTVRVRGPASRMHVLTPEAGDLRPVSFNREGEWAVASVAEFPIHSLVVVETAPRRG